MFSARQQADHPCVVVLDDDPAVGRVVGHMLAEAGCEAVVFSKPDQAAAYITNERTLIDALVCDVQLGTTTGPEVVAGIRDSEPALPVLFMSGDTPVATDERSRFVAKPFDAVTLLSGLVRLLVA